MSSARGGRNKGAKREEDEEEAEEQEKKVSQNLKSWIIANMVRFSDLSEMHFDAQS